MAVEESGSKVPEQATLGRALVPVPLPRHPVLVKMSEASPGRLLFRFGIFDLPPGPSGGGTGLVRPHGTRPADLAVPDGGSPATE